MAAAQELRNLEADLEAQVDHYHPWLLFKAFATAFTPLLLGLWASYGWRPAWPELWAALPGLAAVAAERAWKSAPWAALLAVVHDAQAAARRPAPPLPAAISTPTLKAPIAPPRP